MVKRKDKLPSIVSIALFVFAPALVESSNLYVEAGKMDMEYEIDYQNGTEVYELEPIIVKFGYAADVRNGIFGEAGVHIIGSDDREIIDPFGSLFRTDLGTSLGVHLRLGYQGNRFRLFGGLSATNLDTEYTEVSSGISDKENAALLGGSLGLSVEPVDNVHIVFERWKTSGDAKYSTFIGPDNPDVSFDGYSLGVNVQF